MYNPYYSTTVRTFLVQLCLSINTLKKEMQINYSENV